MKQNLYKGILKCSLLCLCTAFGLGCSPKSKEAQTNPPEVPQAEQQSQETQAPALVQAHEDGKKDMVAQDDPVVVHEPIPGWPQTDDEMVSSPDIPVFSKYALATYRALGCPFSDTPEDAHANTSIFDIHMLEDCHQSKDMRLFKQLIAQKADINAYNAEGKTLLSLSLYHAGGDIESEKETPFFEFLIQMGADITHPNADGSTLLMETEFIQTAQKYIAAGGDIHAKNKQGKTALELQHEKLKLMQEGREFEGNRFPYFHEEASMLCRNQSDMDAAKTDGKDVPKCVTYADVMRDNIRQIIALLEKP